MKNYVYGVQGCQTLEKERETIMINNDANNLFNKIKIGDTLEIDEDCMTARIKPKNVRGIVCIKTKGIVIIQLENYRKSYNKNDFISNSLKFRIVGEEK